MGIVSTVGSAISGILNSRIGAQIGGSLVNIAGNAITNQLNKAMNSGSNSSAQSGSSSMAMDNTSGGWSQMGTQSGSTEESTQQGSVSGIANALMAALGTATGNNAGSAAAFNQQSAQTANNLQNQQWIGANLLNLASNTIANIMNAQSQSSAMRFNAEQSKLERKWSQMMRGTAYQDTVKDLQKAGLNPILAATQGPTGNYSGAEGSISSQSYQQAGAINAPSAHTATMQAMYDYGNNTSQFIDNMLQTINNAKQSGYTQTASWLEQAMTEGAWSSAKQIESFANKNSESYSNRSSNSNRSNTNTNSKQKGVNGNISGEIGGSRSNSMTGSQTSTFYR